MPYQNEHSCRIREPYEFQEESFRRIEEGNPGQSKPDGRPLSIIIGKLKGKTSTTTQAYRYPIREWSESEARNHCDKEGGRFEPASGPSESEQALSFRYLAALQKPWEYQGSLYAKFRLIDSNQISLPTDPAGVRWGVTYDALKNAVKRLMARIKNQKDYPLVGPPELGHHATEQVAEPVDIQMPDGYADITYKITDPEAQAGVKDGSWHFVSPEVVSRNKAFEIQPDGSHLLHDFDFSRLAFVEKGAFPKDEIKNVWEAEMLHNLRAELFQGHPDSAVSGEGLIDGAPSTLVGPQGADQINAIKGGISLNNGEKEGTLPESKKEEVASPPPASNDELAKLQAELADTKLKLEAAQRMKSKNEYEAAIGHFKKELDTLREWKASKEAQDHASKISNVVDLAVRAGLVDETEKPAAVEKMKVLSAQALDILAEQYEPLVIQIESGMVPKTKFAGSKQGSSPEDAVYMRQFGRPRPKEHKEYD